MAPYRGDVQFTHVACFARAACCLLLLLAVSTCGTAQARQPPRRETATGPDSRSSHTGPDSRPSRAGRRRPAGTARSCPATIAPGFSCPIRQRIAAVERYLADTPGETGIEVHDRQTGATWQNAYAQTQFPTGSTSKLAMAADLLLRNESGGIQLSGDDWDQLGEMLNWSSDTAADNLWFGYEDDSFLGRIEQLGMQGAEFTQEPGYWGYMYCTASDLSNLMNYILSDAPGSVRDYLVSQMRGVAGVQQWGVWGAGPENHPGDKDGWEDDDGTWIVDTVGFAGPGERYTLSEMYDMEGNDPDGDADFTYGSDVLTQVASDLFQGHKTAAPTVQATP